MIWTSWSLMVGMGCLAMADAADKQRRSVVDSNPFSGGSGGGDVDAGGTSSATISTNTPTTSTIPVQVKFDQPDITAEENSTFTFTVTAQAFGSGQPPYSIILCQIPSGQSMTDGNAYTVANVSTDICLIGPGATCGVNQNVIQLNSVKPTGMVDLVRGSLPSTAGSSNLFFCFAKQDLSTSHDVCYYYSSIFELKRSSKRAAKLVERQDTSTSTAAAAPSQGSAGTAQVVATLLTITQTSTGIINNLLIPSTITRPSSTVISPATTSVSVSLTFVTTSPTSTEATNAAASKKSSGLSIGAKVGIALGALGFVSLLLLAALFCLRRKHSKRGTLVSSQPEQVMLTRDMHTDSFSRNLMMMEKDRGLHHHANESTIHSLSQEVLDTPLAASHSHSRTQSNASLPGMGIGILPIQRHSASSPYEAVPTGPVSPPMRNSTSSSSPPQTHQNATSGIRRKPTNSTISTSTTSPPTSPIRSQYPTQHAPVSPRSISSLPPPPPAQALQPTPPGATKATTTSHSNSNSSETTDQETTTPFESYHDTPIYRDARHVPQVYTSSEQPTRVVLSSGSVLSSTSKQTPPNTSHASPSHPNISRGPSNASTIPSLNEESTRGAERNSSSPFLHTESERDGLSRGEAARLAEQEEEEERRIDAAIAAAERDQERRGSGLR